jgi:hypothetical protein
VGVDEGTPVTEEYKSSDSAFTGKIRKVIVEVGPMKLGAAATEELEKTKLARKAGE